MSLSPAQCRAARALIGWSQDQLAESSRVAKATIANFEADNRAPYARTLADLQSSLEVAGVEFIPENGGGAGVRLRTAVPRLEARRISRFDGRIQMRVAYRGDTHAVQFSSTVLDDMDRTNYESDAAFAEAFDAHQAAILMRAAAAIDAGRAGTGDQPLILSQDDFSGLI